MIGKLRIEQCKFKKTDFNGMSTSLGLFYAYTLGNYNDFFFTFSCSFLANTICTNLVSGILTKCKVIFLFNNHLFANVISGD